jgi:hypothetical protein
MKGLDQKQFAVAVDGQSGPIFRATVEQSVCFRLLNGPALDEPLAGDEGGLREVGQDLVLHRTLPERW